MTNFDQIFDELITKTKELIALTVKNYISQAEADTTRFLNESKNKFEKWAKLLLEKRLSIDEFEWLIQSQKDLLTMEALKQAGLAKIRIDQFKNSLLNLVTDVILAAIPL
ncbi:MAG: hypothetical protein ACKVPJ_13340 [Chitinophagales bacterium]